MTLQPWDAVRAASWLRVAGLVVAELPTRFGVYPSLRDGEPVYAGKAAGRGGLRERLRSHLGTGTDPSMSSLRRNVAQMVLGIPTTVSKRRPTVITVEQAAVVTAWLRACELAWFTTSTAAAAVTLERDLFAVQRPPLSKR